MGFNWLHSKPDLQQLVWHDFLGQVHRDTEEALTKILRERHVICFFVTLEDVSKAGRITVFNAGGLDADFALDGELIMLRRRVGKEIVYYDQASLL